VVPFFKPVEVPAAGPEFGYSTRAKNGFFKFTLSDPAFAFGHADYPALLANVLTANSRLSKFRLLKPLPNPPYTPLINVISVNYRAAARIDLAQFNPAAASLAEEKLFHIHPFGIEEVSPASHRTIRLLPPYDSNGNLFIGLSAGEVAGVITLFFHLREDSSAAANGEYSEFSWHYLSSNEWKRLEPNRVISDTTRGFRTSGIVTLDLPQDINPDNSIMPGDLFWLRVSLDEHPEAPCSLFAVFTQALKVSWQPGEHSLAHLQKSLPAGTIKSARTSIPGISQIKQIVDSFGGRLPESPSHLRIRVSERLKHKNRATTAWDYERLILERFPEILKVKCFDNMVADPQNFIRPGHILIVVIPQLKEQSPESMQPMVNSGLLAQIKAFVAQLASPFARIEVRNPAYERIQIRCTVKLRRGTDPGYAINALNQALNAYLSPWHQTGYRARFGWKVRRYDLESYIQHLEYIEYVEKFSMLRIVEHQREDTQIEDDGPFDLLDTVPAVHAAVISGDRRRLVTAGSDGTARVWDLDAPDPAATQMVLRGHHDDVLAAAFSPNGRLLVTTGSDRTARIWDLSAGDPLKARRALAGHAGAVLSAVVSPDGRRLATTSSDHTACIWDLEADDPARTRQILEGHTAAVRGAVFSPDGRRLVTTGSDRTARIWDLTDRDPSRSPVVLTGHRDAVTVSAISPDGGHLVTTGHDNTVRIWDLSGRKPSQPPRVLRGHGGTVLAVAFSADGSRLATAGRDNTARLWDLKNAERDEALQVFEGHNDALLAVAISPDSRRLVTAGSDNSVRLWDIAADDRSQIPRTLRVPPDSGIATAESGNVPWIMAAAVSPDGGRLATVSSDNTVRLWDLTAEDSAATPVIDLGSADEEVREIRPACPWSIATPVRRHFIRTTDGTAPKPPQKTGVDELEIGSTFIITGK
jgi:WD40 repeat protein